MSLELLEEEEGKLGGRYVCEECGKDEKGDEARGGCQRKRSGRCGSHAQKHGLMAQTGTSQERKGHGREQKGPKIELARRASVQPAEPGDLQETIRTETGIQRSLGLQAGRKDGLHNSKYTIPYGRKFFTL